MWTAKIIEAHKKMIGLKWSGNIKQEEVDQANQKLEQLIKLLGTESFDLVVEIENLLAFSQDTQKKMIEQQNWLLSKGLNRSAVVVDQSVTKMQLNTITKISGHSNEWHFASLNQALEYLSNHPE